MSPVSKTAIAAPGLLEAIWLKRTKRGPMDARAAAVLVVGRGLRDNADQGGKRQVTLIELERWQEAEQQLGRSVDPSSRRANLLLSGIRLEEQSGRVLRIGDARLLLHGETRPCERMDQAAAGLRAALAPDWRGGAYGEVLEGGTIEIGAPVRWAG